MEAFEVYKEYLALKKHFSLDNYDYFVYKGHIRCSEASFSKRNDRYAFVKLSRHSDPKGLILANLIEDPKAYVGTFNSPAGNNCYLAWLKRKESLHYTFKSDLSRLNQESFLSNLRVTNGKHPLLLRKFLGKQVCLESLLVIDSLTSCFDKWNTDINDPVVWPDVYKMCSKYSGFVTFDTNRMRDILLDRYA